MARSRQYNKHESQPSANDNLSSALAIANSNFSSTRWRSEKDELMHSVFMALCPTMATMSMVIPPSYHGFPDRHHALALPCCSTQACLQLDCGNQLLLRACAHVNSVKHTLDAACKHQTSPHQTSPASELHIHTHFARLNKGRLPQLAPAKDASKHKVLSLK